MRRTVPILLALTVAAAALRLPFLETQSLSYDETFMRDLAGVGSLTDLWSGIKATEATPPLSYLGTWAWAHLTGSTSDAVVRTLPAVSGVVAVPVAFLAFRRWTGEAIALATAALLAVAPVMVAYSLIARAYMPVVLIALLSLWALSRALERPSWGRLALWGVTAAACLWTHYFSVFLVAAEGIALLCLLRGSRLRVATAGALTAVAALPLVALVSAQADGRSDDIGTHSLGERLEQLVRQFATGPNAPGPLLEGVGLALAAAGFAWGGWRLIRRGPRARLPLVFALVVPAASLLLDAVGIDNHFFMRNLLTVWACAAAVIAAGLLVLRGVPLAAYIVVCLAVTLVVNTDWRYEIADWRAASNALPPRVPVVIYPSFAQRVAERYTGGTPEPRVTTREVVVAVEPGRIDRRDLRPLRGFPAGGVPGFTLRAVEEREGFRLLRFEAPAPTAVDPLTLAPDVLGARPALLAR